MPTFLTTKKMSPELAARVETSVRGHRGPSKRSPGARSLMRIGVLALVASLVASFVVAAQGRKQEREEARAKLLEDVKQQAADLTWAEQTIVSKMEVWLGLSSGDYEGDVVSGLVRTAAGLQQQLARPMAYVRGPIDGFRSSDQIANTASTSFKDAFVLCLLDPPDAHTEKALKRRAQAVFAGGPYTEAIDHVARLNAAIVGLPFLSLPWQNRVLAAEDMAELRVLRAAFDRAPLAAAKRVAKAELLLSVMDEPNDGSGPTELDGACPHQARVELREVASERVLLRLRKHVDPGWISPNVRVEYSSGINGCELAMAVREELSR